MSSVNKVILLGRLGKDPELKFTPSGQAVCNFSMATSESYLDKQGNKNEITEWHNIVVWGKSAENAAKFLAKGRLAFIEGKLKTRSWDDKQTGQKRYATDVQADKVTFLPSGQNEQRQGQQQSQQSEMYDAPMGQQPTDDIPF